MANSGKQTKKTKKYGFDQICYFLTIIYLYVKYFKKLTFKIF